MQILLSQMLLQLWSIYVILKLLKATIEFLWWVGVHSHFCVQHSYSVEVVLCFVVIGVVTSQSLSYSDMGTLITCCQESFLIKSIFCFPSANSVCLCVCGGGGGGYQETSYHLRYHHYNHQETQNLEEFQENNIVKTPTTHHPTIETQHQRSGAQNEYQLSSARGTLSLPVTPHRLQKTKNPLGDPKMADGGWKGVYPRFLGAPVNFSKISFLIRAHPLREKVVMKKMKENGGGKNKTDV